MVEREADRIVLSFRDSYLRESDLNTLGTGEWINDAVIAFYFELLQSLVNESQSARKLRLYMPWAVGMMVALSPDAGVTSGALLPPLDADLLLLPVNDTFAQNPSDRPNAGCHWSTLIIEKGADDALYATMIDSLEYANGLAAESVIKAYETVTATKVHWKERIRLTQDNGWDCGIYVLLLASRLVQSYFDSGGALIDYKALTAEAITVFREELRIWLKKWTKTLLKGECISVPQVEAVIGKMPR